MFRSISGIAALVTAALLIAPTAQAQWYVSGSIGGNQIVSQSGTIAVPVSDTSSGGSEESGVGVQLGIVSVGTFSSPTHTSGTLGSQSAAGLAPPAFTNVPVKLDFGIGISGNAAVGYRLPWNFHIEVEGGYTHSSVNKLTVAGVSIPSSSADVNIWTGTLNAFYDIPTGTNFVPYLGGGIGAANERASNITIAGTNFGGSSSSTHLLWQVEAGIGYQLSPQFTIRPAYRFQQIDDGNPNTQIHVFKVGLQYNFN